MEITGEPFASGPFAVAPLRFTDEESGEFVDLLAVLWVREGKVALQAFAQGEVLP
jgi:hypothetical protein